MLKDSTMSAESLYADPPYDPPTPAPPRPEKSEVFGRLEWSILDSPSAVQVLGQDSKGALQWGPLSDKANKALLEGAATNPPVSQMKISLEPFKSWEWWDNWDIEEPPPLLVKNADQRPVSVGQAIQAVHDYVVPLRQRLLECMHLNDSQKGRARVFYQTMNGDGSGGEVPGYEIYVTDDYSGPGEICAERRQHVEVMFRKFGTAQVYCGGSIAHCSARY